MDKLQRRSFLKGLGAFAAFGAAGRTVFAAAIADGVPPYAAAQLARAADRVSAHAKTARDGFWFLTDPHVPANAKHSGAMLAHLAKTSPLKRVLFGGDVPEAFGTRYPSDRAAVDAAIADFTSAFVEPCRAAGYRVYAAKGNHDFTVKHDPKTNAGWTYLPEEARKIIVGDWTEKDVVTNEADPTAAYYYFDNTAARIRYVVADTTDSNSSTRHESPWAVRSGVHETQLLWLAEKAFATTPAGWDLVVMHHIPLAGCVGSTDDERRFRNLRQLLEAYQNRLRYHVGEKVVDFRGAKGRILLDLTGHHHCERQTFQKGILHVTEPCDACYNDYIVGSAPWCESLPSKKRGTEYEQTFEAVQFDAAKDLVRFTRVGGGADRTIHLAPRTVRSGETLDLTAPALGGKGPLFWGAYDGDRIFQRPNPKNRYNPLVSYGNDFATVGADGRLVAKIPGEAMVIARAADGEKEIFPVRIEGRRNPGLDAEVKRCIEGRLYGGLVCRSNRGDLATGGLRTLDPEDGPMPADALCDLASVGKTQTAALCALLAAEGMLDVDAPFTEYLTDHVLAKENCRITVRDLATHSGGFDNSKPYMTSDPKAYFEKLYAKRPKWGRGEKFCYACSNFVYLGLIVEKLTGVADLDRVARKMLWDPLGMNQTTWNTTIGDARGVEFVKSTYDGPVRRIGEHNDICAHLAPRPMGNGAAFSTALDMLRFTTDLLRRERFPKAYYDLLFTPSYTREGTRRSFGWGMVDDRGDCFNWKDLGFSDAAIWHTGWTGPAIVVDPKRDFAGVVLGSQMAGKDNTMVPRMRLLERMAELSECGLAG